MASDHQFGVFLDDRKGPMWREYFQDIEMARNYAQKSADEEASEFFIYSFQNFSEVGRKFPTRS